MANTFIKGQQIVSAAQLLLQREIVLPRLVWRQASADYRGQINDTITLRVPAVMAARTRVLRSNTALVADDLTETAVPVKLDTHVYKLLNITDEQLTLDITDFTAQVLSPQVRGVAEGLEDVIGTALDGAHPVETLEFAEGVDEPYDIAVDAAKVLNGQNVPRAGRVLVLGANVEAAFLKSDKLSKVNESGTDTALREATLARVAGFTVVGSNAIDPDAAYAFHQTAIAFGSVAPVVPAGAADGGTIASDGYALRFLRDYNPTNASGPVDRSLVDAFTGATSVENDDDINVRLVSIDFTGAGTES